VAAHAVANALPQTRTLTTPTGTTFIDAPVLSDSTVAVANLAAFLVDLKAAIANSATYAAFQTAVAALPNP
jgi:hypothetical protein